MARTDVNSVFEIAVDFALTLASLNKIVPIIEYSMDGRVTLANERFLSLTGQSAAEILGRPHKALMAPIPSLGPVSSELWKALKTGRTISGNFVVLDAMESVRCIEANFVPVARDDGIPYKVVVAIHDITVQMESVKTAQESNRLLTLAKGALKEATNVLEQLASAREAVPSGDVEKRPMKETNLGENVIAIAAFKSRCD